MPDDFTEAEQMEISRQALQLLKGGYLTGINFVVSDKPLPAIAVIIHYLQDSRQHVDFVLDALKGFGKVETLLLPRRTQYLFDPLYVKKRKFLREYQNAIFVDESLAPKSIEEVVRDPRGTIVVANELDLLIPVETCDIHALVQHIQTSDRLGPERWRHPAIIVKGKTAIPVAPGFITKDYASISRASAEFYSVVADENRKKRLVKRLEKICEQLQTSAQVQLTSDAVIWSPSQINPELNTYFNENQRELESQE